MFPDDSDVNACAANPLIETYRNRFNAIAVY